METQHSIRAIRGNPPSCEHARIHGQHLLLPTRMEGSMATAHLEIPPAAAEDLPAQGGGIGQLCFQLLPLQLLPVDAARQATGLRASAVTARTKHRMEVDARHSLQAQKDGVGGEKLARR